MRTHALVMFLLAPVMAALPVRSQSISNISARIDIAPGGTYIMGFAVPGPNPAILLLRAVGTPLKQFGINNGVTAPDIQLFDSKGNLLIFGTTDGDPVDYPALFGMVGAFALTEPGAFYVCTEFPPGAYTLNLSDDSGAGGTLLFELYVVTGTVPMKFVETPGQPVPTTTIVLPLPGPTT